MTGGDGVRRVYGIHTESKGQNHEFAFLVPFPPLPHKEDGGVVANEAVAAATTKAKKPWSKPSFRILDGDTLAIESGQQAAPNFENTVYYATS